ncbi:unnamed protein product [Protopolystoma xenopodis]|uniref:Uncharacterized protein n=1 Tax=Protopolystoma xenopodis TaxID=117903 RepID=A0A448X6V8_9PLAT|nr:unnamed protein product [Protopolystoma xenopodis]
MGRIGDGGNKMASRCEMGPSQPHHPLLPHRAVCGQNDVVSVDDEGNAVRPATGSTHRPITCKHVCQSVSLWLCTSDCNIAGRLEQGITQLCASRFIPRLTRSAPTHPHTLPPTHTHTSTHTHITDMNNLTLVGG